MLLSRHTTALVSSLMLVVFGCACSPDDAGRKDTPAPQTPAESKVQKAGEDHTPPSRTDEQVGPVAPAPIPTAPEKTHPTETPESVEKKILATFGTIKSFGGDLDVKFASTQDDTWVKNHTYGMVEYLFKGDKVLYRFDMTIETTQFSDSKETFTQETQTLMSDGDFMYQIGEKDGVPTAIKAFVDELQTSVPSEEYFFYLHRDYDVYILPDDQFEGKDVWVIHARMKRTDDELFRMWTDIYIRKDIPVMVKTINYDRYGNIMQVTEIRDLRINIDLDRERFMFKPTPDMEIIDQAW